MPTSTHCYASISRIRPTARINKRDASVIKARLSRPRNMARAFSIGPRLIRLSYHVSDSHASLGQRLGKNFFVGPATSEARVTRSGVRSCSLALARFPSRPLPRSFASKKMRDWIRETKGLIIYVLHEFSTCDSFLNNFRSIYPVRSSSSSSSSSQKEEEERCMPYNPRVSSRLYECTRANTCNPSR